MGLRIHPLPVTHLTNPGARYIHFPTVQDLYLLLLVVALLPCCAPETA